MTSFLETWSLLCAVSTLTSLLVAEGTASCCRFFTSLVMIFGVFMKPQMLSVFVFQYASSPSDCNINQKGTIWTEGTNLKGK